jgi:quercetin dioxygenase-like cupin family protein
MLPSLAALLAPHPVDVWRERSTSKDALVLPGRSLGRLLEITPASLIGSIEHLDVIRGGIGKPVDVVDDALIERVHRDGCSLRIRRTQVLDQTVRDFMFGLYESVGEELNVNAYLSPNAETPGLAPHSDGYDVLVLQLDGAKRWSVHELDPFTLERGDVLFLPAGVRHEAQTTSATASFHLTVGIYAKTQRSLAEWLSSELQKQVTRQPLDIESDFVTFERRVRDLLSDPGCGARFESHRRAVEYERMLAPPTEHARLDARGYW